MKTLTLNPNQCVAGFALRTAVLAMALATASAFSAEVMVGSASGQRLVLFTSDNPEDASVINIKGMQPGEEILGVDQRPATGQLYGLGSSSRLYTFDLVNGTATPVGTGPFATTLSGTSLGFDFNPTVDRIRIVSNTGQNLRAHPVTGAIAAVDSALAYATNDVAAGTSPLVVASAYINNDNNTNTGTVLFNIDAGTDTLVMQTPPNNGTLLTMGALGIDVTAVAGFDVAASDGAAYAALVEAGQPGKSDRASLYSVNLATGAVTSLGKLGGPKPLMSLATLGQVP